MGRNGCRKFEYQDRKRQYHVNGNQKKLRVSSINVKEKKIP